MNKTELYEKAQHLGIGVTREQTKAIMDKFFDLVAAELVKGEYVILPALGKLKIKERPARKARNPRTGEEIEVAARKDVSFVLCANLKEHLRRVK